MSTLKIPRKVVDVKEPCIPFTRIPNPLGYTLFVYENGVRQLVPLYYFQKLVRTVIKLVLFPFRKARHHYLAYRVRTSKYFKTKED